MALATPVSRDGFAFANGDLFAEASGHNRHRRATFAELKEHFKSGSEKDHPAHWFEAQLIHYGLQPSKSKAVSRMRLFDAVNAGGMKVPAHVSKLEAELKKEWTKLDREAKKSLKGSGPAAATTTGTTGKKTGAKRKAEENVDITVNVGGINITVSKGTTISTTQNAAKKAKTTAPAPKAATPSKPAKEKASSSKTKTVTPKPKPTPNNKSSTVKKGSSTAPKSSSSTAARSTQAPKQDPAPQGRTKQTARKSAYCPITALSDGQSDSHYITPVYYNNPVHHTQTARKSAHHPVSALGHDSHNGPMNRYDEPPPPYTEFTSPERPSSNNSSPVRLSSLGLLNGRYDISCPFVSGEWPHYGEDFSLVLTLAGSGLWGNFDLGVVQGVFFLDERPWQSSHDELSFVWRGREDEGRIIYGNSNHGWIKFLGGGRVEGYLDYQGIEFHGERLPGQSTTSEISTREMEREFNGYNEASYDRENRARWG